MPTSLTKLPSRWLERPLDTAVEAKALENQLPAEVAQVIARRCQNPELVTAVARPRLSTLPNPFLLIDCNKSCDRLANAIEQKQQIALLTDYDVDGITSHALLLEALLLLGAERSHLQSHIGHRLKDGYGITASHVDRILESGAIPAVLITADCGSADHIQIARLADAGVDVIVCDHHSIPEQGIPGRAFAVVNPQREDCTFPDQAIAGCMVAFLLMCGLRQTLIQRQVVPETLKKFSHLTDLVALGTVADAVSLASPINRAIIRAGLLQMNRGKRPAWRVLMEKLNSHADGFQAEDLAFQIGPRINARSRVAEPMAALHFLRAETDALANENLAKLETNNNSRKRIEATMLQTAISQALPQIEGHSRCLVIADEKNHAGVQGIVASRLVERFGRPAFVLSPDNEKKYWLGSGRSIEGVDLLAAMRIVANDHPEIFVRFGGHKMAAGCTVKFDQRSNLHRMLNQALEEQLGNKDLSPIVWTDGKLSGHSLTLETAETLAALEPYGRGFEAPLFVGKFEIASSLAIGRDNPIHLKLALIAIDELGLGKEREGIWFNARESTEQDFPVQGGETVQCLYRLVIDTWGNRRRLKLHIRDLRVLD